MEVHIHKRRFRQLGESILKHILEGYLRVLERTVILRWSDQNHYGDSQIYGFWHEDSFFMNRILKELSSRTTPVDVIVTADTRGNYIEHMVRSCGGAALRIPDGYRAFRELRKLSQTTCERMHSIAVALDGPLGPRHVPKKLAFYLSEHAGMEFVGITLHYSACIRLRRRWDQYVIPLPFTTVTAEIHNYGIVSKKEIPKLPVSAKIQNCDIMSGKRTLYLRIGQFLRNRKKLLRIPRRDHIRKADMI